MYKFIEISNKYECLNKLILFVYEWIDNLEKLLEDVNFFLIERI